MEVVELEKCLKITDAWICFLGLLLLSGGHGHRGQYGATTDEFGSASAEHVEDR